MNKGSFLQRATDSIKTLDQANGSEIISKSIRNSAISIPCAQQAAEVAQ
jgi:hypothetical protein